MTLRLNEPPDVLPEPGRHTWTRGLSGAPAVGDLWILAWDNLVELCIVTADRRSYFLCWPVTLDRENASGDAQLLSRGASPIGVELVIWTQAETGLGKHLLARRLGSAINAADVYELRRGATEGIDSEVETKDLASMRRQPVGELEDYLDELLSRFQDLCFHEWPAAEQGDAILRTHGLQSRGIDAETVGSILQITHPGQAASIWHGESLLTLEQIQRLSRELGMTTDELLDAPESDEVDALRQPQYKADVIALCRKRNESEREVRRAVLRDLSLAARHDFRGEDIENRVRSSLSKLLAE